mmetsp:Transcript_25297/g.78008  ORF Transcript_25297/g.78008 Transcript_25297/m.78008 type:complete len:101 (+) Transcript_25297:1295-1597(+)
MPSDSFFGSETVIWRTAPDMGVPSGPTPTAVCESIMVSLARGELPASEGVERPTRLPRRCEREGWALTDLRRCGASDRCAAVLPSVRESLKRTAFPAIGV